jgi:murein L,D-transpeptidase YafK
MASVSAKKSRRTILFAALVGIAGLWLGPGAAAQPLKSGAAPPGVLKADQIVIYKARRTLDLMRGGKVIESFHIMLGEQPVGAKLKNGDGRTPEGFYIIDGRNPSSAYHLSLHISYPNEIDRLTSEDAGVKAGGAIYIHGMPPEFGHTDPIGYFKDWTDGCVAVGNKAIEKIWAAVDVGTEVVIRP